MVLPESPLGQKVILKDTEDGSGAAVPGQTEVAEAASLGAAGRTVQAAAAHGRTHGLGRDQVQVLVVGDLIQTVAVLEQLPAQVGVDLRSRDSTQAQPLPAHAVRPLSAGIWNSREAGGAGRTESGPESLHGAAETAEVRPGSPARSHHTDGPRSDPPAVAHPRREFQNKATLCFSLTRESCMLLF